MEQRCSLAYSGSHTPEQRAAPHNYINFASLKMLISPLTHFGLRAIVPTSPRHRGLACDSPASTFLIRDFS